MELCGIYEVRWSESLAQNPPLISGEALRTGKTLELVLWSWNMDTWSLKGIEKLERRMLLKMTCWCQRWEGIKPEIDRCLWRPSGHSIRSWRVRCLRDSTAQVKNQVSSLPKGVCRYEPDFKKCSTSSLRVTHKPPCRVLKSISQMPVSNTHLKSQKRDNCCQNPYDA